MANAAFKKQSGAAASRRAVALPALCCVSLSHFLLLVWRDAFAFKWLLPYAALCLAYRGYVSPLSDKRAESSYLDFLAMVVALLVLGVRWPWLCWLSPALGAIPHSEAIKGVVGWR